ncbi:MAG: hypothetical protein QNK37_36290 [Acidobacteriota bacterium]|nr:hypothetical protein [Acidobacteriota bacterium]
MNIITRPSVLVLSLVVFLTGCTLKDAPVTDAKAQVETAADATLEERYKTALDASIIPTPGKIYRGLVPLREDTPGLKWDSKGRVLVATWTDRKWYEDYEDGRDFPLAVDLWVSPAPQVEHLCSEYEDDNTLNLRIAQFLGMPPNRVSTHFVELWVHPDDIFRPCPDREVTDSECRVGLSSRNQEAETDGPPPPWYWFCGSGSGAQTGSEEDRAHLAWMCNNWFGNYVKEGTFLERYPWTALGYAYDWFHPEAPYGASEYIVLKGKQASVERIVPTGAYCGR